MADYKQEGKLKPHFVRGLDSFRFLAALTVAGSHGFWPPFSKMFGKLNGVTLVVGGVWNSLPNGILAVCVFFFISGFCIHFPNIDKNQLDRTDFLIKRMVRIGIPLLVVIYQARLLGNQYVESLDAVLWSIYCELAYYIIYPFILPLLQREMSKSIFISILLSAAVLLVHPFALRPWNFGVFTFIFCAPMWMLGADLAARYKNDALILIPHFPTWALRAAIVAFSISSIIVFYHFPIKVPLTWSVLLFTPLAYLWLGSELQQLRHRTPVLLFEKIGAASYSIYLVHKLVLTYVVNNVHGEGISFLYVIQIVLAVCVIGAFYMTVERPSHSLAKWLAMRWRHRGGCATIS